MILEHGRLQICIFESLYNSVSDFIFALAAVLFFLVCLCYFDKTSLFQSSNNNYLSFLTVLIIKIISRLGLNTRFLNSFI